VVDRKILVKDCYVTSLASAINDETPGKNWRIESNLSWGVATLLCCFE